jgi:hypothetical protein
VSSRFVKKLQKDLKRSPGKAVVLAALLGVAMWFWAPLVTNFVVGAPAPTPAVVDAPNKPVGLATTASATVVPSEPQYTWKQVAAAIDHDPRMLPAEQVALPRDPFRAIKPEKPKEEQVTVVEPPPAILDVPPGDAGLVLTSTMVSPRRRVARLNGKTYREGDLIEASVDNKPLRYKLVSVRGRSVVVALGDKEYTLKMLRAQANAATGTVSISSDSPDFDPTILEEPE